MDYQKTSVPIMNSSFRFLPLKKGRILFSVGSDLGVIQCSHSAFSDVVDSIDGNRTFEEVERCLGQKYPLEGIRTYFDAMLREGIVRVRNDAVAGEIPPISILVVGEGRLRDAVIRAIEVSPCQITVLTCKEVNWCESWGDADTIVLAPDGATYGDFLDANEAMIKSGRPFFPFYFAGEELVAGPFVIPGKTACFSCQSIYHLQAVNDGLEKRARLTLDDLRDFSAALPVPSNFSDAMLSHVAETILEDITRLFSNGKLLQYYECERRFKGDSSTSITEIEYWPTTECDCCHGRIADYREWGSTSEPDKATDFFEAPESPIVYSVGGMRSLDTENTRLFIDKAFESAGIHVEIERQTVSALHRIIPCYKATMSGSHGNSTPFFFKKVISRGKGLDEDQAYLSASFEMAERISAQCNGDLPTVTAPFSELEEDAVDVRLLAKNIANPNNPYEKFSSDLPMDWVWGTSLVDGRKRLVPAFLASMGGVRFKGQFLGNGSSGLAAGATLEDAVLQGLIELVEHDAWTIGQANRVVLPRIDISSSNNGRLLDYCNRIASIGREVICRDYTNDIGIPAIRCWIVNPSNYSHYALNGFGASLSAEIALERAITEAVLSDTLTYSRRTHYGAHSALGIFTAIDSLYSLGYFQQKDIAGDSGEVTALQQLRASKANTIRGALLEVVARIKKAIPDCDILFVDLTKQGLGVPVVRVLIVGDIQILNRPMLSISPRTFQFGEAMGYMDRRPEMTDFFMGQYPH